MEIPSPRGGENVFLATRRFLSPTLLRLSAPEKKYDKEGFLRCERLSCRERATRSDNATKTGQREKSDAQRHATPSPKYASRTLESFSKSPAVPVSVIAPDSMT